MNLPLVSVIIPVYNGEHYLAQAIESVFAQTYKPIELIIIDDGSFDNSSYIARSFKEICYHYQINKGVAVARNAGIAVSNGEFIAFLDQDDIWTHNKLNVQIDYLLNHPEADGVLSKQRLFLEPGIAPPKWLKRELLQKEQTGYFPSSMVVRKDVFSRIGVFDPVYKHTSDVDWIARVKDAGILMIMLPEALFYRRIHSANTSAETQIIHPELLKTLKKSIERQRVQKSLKTDKYNGRDNGK
jgi:glycosyltransferase involved in cell wall biosynthesis